MDRTQEVNEKFVSDIIIQYETQKRVLPEDVKCTDNNRTRVYFSFLLIELSGPVPVDTKHNIHIGGLQSSSTHCGSTQPSHNIIMIIIIVGPSLYRRNYCVHVPIIYCTEVTLLQTFKKKKN